MISNRPYLLRAFNQWIIDSSCTPILVLDANNPRCKAPRDFAEGGEIVFNISQDAVRDLVISNESVDFKASFSGVIHIISAPIKAVLAVYAEENGEGIFFDADEDTDTDVGIDAEEVVQLKGIDGSGSAMNTAEMGINLSEAKVKPFLKLVE